MAKITDDDIADIEALYREVVVCLPDDGRLAELSRQFHFRIYECAPSPMLTRGPRDTAQASPSSL